MSPIVLRGTGVAVADGYLGVHEEPPHSNKTIIGEKFGWNGVAWCAEFYSVCEKEAGNTDFASSASCSVLIDRYKSGQNGIWLGKPADMNAILVDDEVFFGRNGGDHTGRVKSVDADARMVYTIEGNIGDAVRNEDRPYNGGVEVIYGFGRPGRLDAPGAPTPPPPGPQAPATLQGSIAMPPVSKGSKDHATVTLAQRGLWLLGENLGRYGADGDYGKDTTAAVHSFQSKHHPPIDVDGAIGPQTWTALTQGLLHIAVDGDYGPQTTSAVVAFQQTHGLVVDGVTGPATFTQLVGG